MQLPSSHLVSTESEPAGVAHQSVYRPSSFHHTVIYLQMEGWWYPASSKAICAIFPAAFAHFMPLCHILVILTICQSFSSLLYLNGDL